MPWKFSKSRIFFSRGVRGGGEGVVQKETYGHLSGDYKLYFEWLTIQILVYSWSFVFEKRTKKAITLSLLRDIIYGQKTHYFPRIHNFALSCFLLYNISRLFGDKTHDSHVFLVSQKYLQFNMQKDDSNRSVIWFCIHSEIEVAQRAKTAFWKKNHICTIVHYLPTQYSFTSSNLLIPLVKMRRCDRCSHFSFSQLNQVHPHKCCQWEINTNFVEGVACTSELHALKKTHYLVMNVAQTH